MFVSTGYRLCLATFLALLTQKTAGQETQKSVAGCGNYQQVVRLLCSDEKRIQLVSILASHKENCKASNVPIYCPTPLPSSHYFYMNVTAECQGHPTCELRLPQVVVENKCNGFPNVTIWKNFIQIYYFCTSSGGQQPTSTERTDIATILSTQMVTATSDVTERTNTSDSTIADFTSVIADAHNHTTAVNATDGLRRQDNSQVLIPAIISMSVIVALVLLFVLLAVGYRKRKLPTGVQERLGRAGAVVRHKTRTLITRTQRNRAAPAFKQHLPSNIQISKINVEEEIYSNIDEMNNSNGGQSYAEWSPEGIDGESRLPRILVIPTSKPVSKLSNHYSPDPALEEVEEDDCWSDSEFDSSSDEEKEEKPRPPVYSDAGRSSHNSPGCAHLYAAFENGAPISCSCVNRTQEQTNPKLADQHIYCTPQVVTHTEANEQSCYYSATPLSSGKLTIVATGVNPTFQDDSEYYSAAAPYMGESST